MKHLLQDWSIIERQIGEKKVVLCLDFDGTLSPIAPMPEMAVFPEENREIVEALGRNPMCALAIVSGRALCDVKEKVSISDIMYIGNHGLEAEGPQFHFESLAPPQDTQTMEQLKKDLGRELDGIEGVFVEDKGLTLSVHYRLANVEDEPLIQKLVLKTCHPYLAEKKIHLWEGKKVLEIRPSLDWDKGKAVLWLLSRERDANQGNVFPIYVGDDVTDEDAFRALQGQGLGILVGLSDLSDAHYYLNGPDEVTDFLRHLLEFMNQRTLARGRA
jgi:trehalose 6-phosphate phosphatase